MGSNGLTSARHDVFCKKYAEKYPETYDHDVPYNLIYSGSCKLTDPVNGIDRDMGKLVLSPTRTYLPVVNTILKELRNEIHGMIHCSGGGQTKILHFINALHVVKDNLFPTPPLFSIIQSQSGTDWMEMYKTFNMGHRLEIYIPHQFANQIINISKSYNIDAQIIGYCEHADCKRLTIQSPYGTFEY